MWLLVVGVVGSCLLRKADGMVAGYHHKLIYKYLDSACVPQRVSLDVTTEDGRCVHVLLPRLEAAAVFTTCALRSSHELAAAVC